MPDLLRLAIVLLACGAIAIVGAAWLMARLALRPPRMTDGKATYLLGRVTPADLGLPFEVLTFTVRDTAVGHDARIDISGWWLLAPGGSGRTAVLLHGHADAKVGALSWAPMLLQLGFNVCALDLRAHGESGGTFTTAGVYERHDVDAVINELKAIKPDETRAIVLYGVSLGGAVALATAALRDDVAAVVVDGPFTDFPSALRVHAKLTGAPGGFIPALAASLAAWAAGGVDFTAVPPLVVLPKVRCPVLVMHGEDDPFAPLLAREAFARALVTAAAGSRLVTLPHVGHLRGLPDAIEAYVSEVSGFLNTVVGNRC